MNTMLSIVTFIVAIQSRILEKLTVMQVIKKIFHPVWKPKVYYDVLKVPLVDLIQNLRNSVHIFKSYLRCI